MERFRRALLGAAFVIGGLAGAAVVAEPAAAGLEHCGANFLCLWEDNGFNTDGNGAGVWGYGTWDGDFSNNVYNGTTKTVMDNASSVANHQPTQTAIVFNHTGCNGAGGSFSLTPGQNDNNLDNSTGSVPFNFNDRASSGAFGSTLGSC